MNPFQPETTANRHDADRVGARPGDGGGEPYPGIPADQRLFDRGRHADVDGGAAAP